jgi:hypothetical protein
MIKIKTIPIHLQGLSEYHQWMTSLLKTPAWNKFTYYSILSRVDCKYAIKSIKKNLVNDKVWCYIHYFWEIKKDFTGFEVLTAVTMKSSLLNCHTMQLTDNPTLEEHNASVFRVKGKPSKQYVTPKHWALYKVLPSGKRYSSRRTLIMLKIQAYCQLYLGRWHQKV